MWVSIRPRRGVHFTAWGKLKLFCFMPDPNSSNPEKREGPLHFAPGGSAQMSPDKLAEFRARPEFNGLDVRFLHFLSPPPALAQDPVKVLMLVADNLVCLIQALWEVPGYPLESIVKMGEHEYDDPISQREAELFELLANNSATPAEQEEFHRMCEQQSTTQSDPIVPYATAQLQAYGASPGRFFVWATEEELRQLLHDPRMVGWKVAPIATETTN